MRGSNYKALTGKILVFWASGDLLIEGGCVFAYERRLHMDG